MSTRRAFSWEGARQELSGPPHTEKGLNIAYEAIERHAHGERREHVALRWLGKNGAVEDSITVSFRIPPINLPTS